jgi:transposase
MVWGGFMGNMKSPLVIFEPGRINAQKYIDRVLRPVIAPFLLENRRMLPILMEDNAPIHKAEICTLFKAEYRVSVMIWPPYSPDLNPIENVWREMKHHISSQRIAKSKAQHLIQIQEAWDAVGANLLNAFMNSMPRRMRAVIKAKGYHTKY